MICPKCGMIACICKPDFDFKPMLPQEPILPLRTNFEPIQPEPLLPIEKTNPIIPPEPPITLRDISGGFLGIKDIGGQIRGGSLDGGSVDITGNITNPMGNTIGHMGPTGTVSPPLQMPGPIDYLTGRPADPGPAGPAPQIPGPIDYIKGK